MTIETQVAGLINATTTLTEAVNTSKATLDAKVAAAAASAKLADSAGNAAAALASRDAASTSAATAVSQATIATDKATIATDKATIATDKATIATDKAGLAMAQAALAKSAADAVGTKLGYSVPVPYAAGISITLATQTVSNAGLVYASNLADLPFTTSGTFETAKFRLIQGVVASDLADKTDPTKGSTLLGDYGRSVRSTIRNYNSANSLKKLLTNLYSSANSARFNVRLVGTSIQTGGSCGSFFAKALQDWFGASQSTWSPFASQAEQKVFGWSAQYYSGTYSIRICAGNGDGSVPYVLKLKASSITIFYSKEADGGAIGVTTRVGGAVAVAQADINCNGASSFGNAVTYTLDPNVFSTVTLTAPTGVSFAYLESYVADAGDFGMMVANTSYGGSSLWNHTGLGPAGVTARTPVAGMYPSATPSGNLGLLSTVAPTHTQVKPALVIYSGPTNDVSGGATAFATNVESMVSASVANGASMILVIEPVNLTYDSGGNKTAWQACRDVFYAQALARPDSVFVYDFDAFISEDLRYSTKFHETGDTTHPKDNGFGNPHLSAAADLSQRVGIPNLRAFTRSPRRADLATSFTGATEPLTAPVGSLWTDVSNSATPMVKKKIAHASGLGLWECLSGDNSVPKGQSTIRSANALNGGASVIDAVNFMGQPARQFGNANTGFWLGDGSPFVRGDIYTLSFLAESALFTQTIMSIIFGTSGQQVSFDPQLGALFAPVGSVPANAPVGSNGSGDVQRFALTFRVPTLNELNAAGVGGDQSGRWTLQATTPGNLVIWDWKIERGASVTTGTVSRGGIIYTKAGDPVAEDIPTGRSMTWTNTTTGITKQWANIAGVLKSVAFA